MFCSSYLLFEAVLIRESAWQCYNYMAKTLLKDRSQEMNSLENHLMGLSDD